MVYKACGKEGPQQNRGMGVSFQGPQAASTLHSLGHTPAHLNMPPVAECLSCISHVWVTCAGDKKLEGSRNTGGDRKSLSNTRFATYPNCTVSLAKKGFREPSGGGLASCGS